MYVIVANKDNSVMEVSVVDLGFSDHLAKIVKIKINNGKGNRRDKIVQRKQLTNNNIIKTYYLRKHGMRYLITKI